MLENEKNNLNFYISHTRLTKSTLINDIIQELYLAVVIEPFTSDIKTINKIVETKSANPLEFCILVASELLTLNINAIICYGQADTVLLQPLDCYLQSETLFGNNFNFEKSNQYEECYFVLINDIVYIPYKLTACTDTQLVPLIQFGVDSDSHFTINQSWEEFKSNGYQKTRAIVPYTLKTYSLPAFCSFSSKYPDKQHKLEFKDCHVEYYEDRKDSMISCQVIYNDDHLDSTIIETYSNRADCLATRTIIPKTTLVTEYFHYGRKDGLKSIMVQGTPVEYEFYDCRPDCLVKRQLLPIFKDFFSIRQDDLLSRVYLDNIFINTYGPSTAIDILEINVITDTVKIVFKPNNPLRYQQSIEISKNSISAESKELYNVLNCNSYDYKSSQLLKKEISNYYDFILYEVTKIVNERTEIQTKMDGIMKERQLQEKSIFDSENATIISDSTKKPSTMDLIQTFMQHSNPEEAIKDFFTTQFKLKRQVLNDKLKSSLIGSVDHQVIEKKLDRLDQDKSNQIDQYLKVLASISLK